MPEIKSSLQNIQAIFFFFNKKEKHLAPRQFVFVRSALSLTAKPLSGKIRIIISV